MQTCASFIILHPLYRTLTGKARCRSPVREVADPCLKQLIGSFSLNAINHSRFPRPRNTSALGVYCVLRTLVSFALSLSKDLTGCLRTVLKMVTAPLPGV